MAKIVLKDVFILVNGVNFSDHVDTVTVDDSADEVEQTAFSNTYKQYQQGMKDATISLTFHQDFAAASVDATLAPLYAAGSAFPVEIRPTSAARSATNPARLMQSTMFGYSPLQGSVGELSKTEVAFRCADNNGVQRLTA